MQPMQEARCTLLPVVIPARLAAVAGGVAVAAALSVGVAQLQAAPVASCPSRDRTIPRTKLPSAAGQLVPSGTTGVLLCRYRGLNPYAKRFRLIASDKVSNAATAAQLSEQLNALQKLVGVSACPDDTGALIIAYFHDPHAADDIVSVDTSGCEPVSNGHVHRTASLPPGPQLVRELEAMTR